MLREKVAQALMIQATKKMLKMLRRSTLRIDADDEVPTDTASSRLGGLPLVPADFEWPYHTGKAGVDDIIGRRPLAFLAQFRCEELHAAAPGNPLPEKGMLSFFYELESQPWGFSPEDAGCARVYWFPETEGLHAAPYPQDLAEEYRLPAYGVGLTERISYPDWEDLSAMQPRLELEMYEEALEKMGIDIYEEYGTKLLGWPNIIQNSMTDECEWVTQGYYMGGSNPPQGLKNPPEPETPAQKAQQLMLVRQSVQNWRLLWQLESETAEQLGLIFGDCGTLYFYIREEDLKAKRFDRVWLILQCG